MKGLGRHTIGWLFILAAFCTPLGCQSLRIEGLNPRADKQGKEEQAALGPPPPSKRHFRISQFVFWTDFELKQDQPIFKELAKLPDLVSKELQLPLSHALVQVYLFEGREQYERFMQIRYPDLPKRRAFFVAQPRAVGTTEDLLVYTHWGARIQEDLRHELTHALLHSVLKDVPLWLDEGLAEYFELPPDTKGINGKHLEQIRKDPPESFKPDLARLEELSQVQQMTPSEYREAWAWVHLILADKPEAKAVLVQYLQQLRTNPTPGPLSPRLASIYPSLNEALTKHLATLDIAKASPRPKNALGIQ
ncbi:MAG TPA: DUF1570 domain-containing protein [Gemmataceae bacterium]|jgi:hypothetical protein|nr:DUF1570 domain-containing protein [Gemmataceae bacterium]